MHILVATDGLRASSSCPLCPLVAISGHSEPGFGMSENRRFADVIACMAIPGFPYTAPRTGTKRWPHAARMTQDARCGIGGAKLGKGLTRLCGTFGLKVSGSDSARSRTASADTDSRERLSSKLFPFR